MIGTSALRQALRLFAASALLAAHVLAGDEPSVRIFPPSVGAMHELGLVNRGYYSEDGPILQSVRNAWIDHFGAYISQRAVVNERLFVSAGLGGVFQFRKPEVIQPGYFGSQRKAFFIGPTTEAVYHFGNPEKPYLKLGMGNFWYKYNPEASNLGEYLFRSGAYPTYTYTGGYLTIGSAGAQLQGFKAQYVRGGFTADLLFTTETSLAPFYNWSPAALASYRFGDGLFELGAGVNFKNLVQVKPSRSTPHTRQNGYFRYQGNWYYADADYYDRQATFYQLRYESSRTAADSAQYGSLQAAAAYTRDSVVFKALDDPLNNPAALPDSLKPGLKYFDAFAVLATARASFDPKKLFASSAFGPQDLKLYGEVGVLGVKNYPVFYKNTSERMPIMVGFNLPAFKLLDLFAVQVEYLNSPWLNNTLPLSLFPANVPFLPDANDSLSSGSAYNDAARRDDFKWSLLLKKSFGPLSLSAQAASDHLRLPSALFYYGPQFDPNEITVTKRHWYFMTQISWGI